MMNAISVLHWRHVPIRAIGEAAIETLSITVGGSQVQHINVAEGSKIETCDLPVSGTARTGIGQKVPIRVVCET